MASGANFASFNPPYGFCRLWCWLFDLDRIDVAPFPQRVFGERIRWNASESGRAGNSTFAQRL
jgi:hypothetical protein